MKSVAKQLAECGAFVSVSEAKRHLHGGKIRVNNSVVREDTEVQLQAGDEVFVCGKKVATVSEIKKD